MLRSAVTTGIASVLSPTSAPRVKRRRPVAPIATEAAVVDLADSDAEGEHFSEQEAGASAENDANVQMMPLRADEAALADEDAHYTEPEREPARKRQKRQWQKEPDEYEVDTITERQFSAKAGSYEYYVLWKGYPASEGTWETRENLKNAQKKIEECDERRRAARAQKIQARRFGQDASSSSTIQTIPPQYDLQGYSKREIACGCRRG